MIVNDLIAVGSLVAGIVLCPVVEVCKQIVRIKGNEADMAGFSIAEISLRCFLRDVQLIAVQR